MKGVWSDLVYQRVVGAEVVTSVRAHWRCSTGQSIHSSHARGCYTLLVVASPLVVLISRVRPKAGRFHAAVRAHEVTFFALFESRLRRYAVRLPAAKRLQLLLGAGCCGRAIHARRSIGAVAVVERLFLQLRMNLA